LGVLHIVFGAIGVFGAVIVLMIFGGISTLVGMSDRAGDVPAPIMAIIGGVVFIVVLALSLPSLIIGIGLVQFRPWARIGGIILSALDLFGFPFHTALGIYGLWVLLSRETEQIFGVPPARVA
jgi:hypothetical protein